MSLTRRTFQGSLGASLLSHGAEPRPAVGPADMPVMEQVFWIEFAVAPESAAAYAVACPAGVKLLDRTKPGRNRPRTRFYFRSDRPIAGESIRFSPAAGEAVEVNIRVLSYREDIEDKSRDLEGFTAGVRKAGGSYYSDAMVRAARESVAAYPELRAELHAPTRFEGMSDAAIWESLPSWHLPRQLYSNWPCPYDGEKIYTLNAFYPWRAQDPFHCECPLCHRFFPTNDFAADDFTSGDFPDDGSGWDSTGTGAFDDRYPWVAFANEQRWHGTGTHIQRLAWRYLLEGDRASAHRAALLLARLAYIYPGMRGYAQPRSWIKRPYKIDMEQQWESTAITVPALKAYDAVWEYIPSDEPLLEFLNAKDASLHSPDDIRGVIDVYFAQHLALNFMRRWYHGDNGQWEMNLISIALAANMGPLSERWMREVFTHAYNTNANEGGLQDSVMVNYLTREGPTNIGAFLYTTLSLDYFSEIAACVERYPDPRLRTACNLYDVRRFPRVRAMGEAFLDMVVAGQFFPQFGDTGDARGYRWSFDNRRAFYLNWYRHWPGEKAARMLARLKTQRPELPQLGSANHPEVFDSDPWPSLKETVAKLGPEPPTESRVQDGVGFVFLESRAGETDLSRRAGLAFRYGYGWGHAHDDNLNVQYWAKGACVVPELGYPNWMHKLGASGQTVHHITGMIDRRDQYGQGKGKGALELFSATPEAAFADCSATPSGFPASVYRRGICLADAPGGNSYIFDVFRLAGGTTRTYCFHGPVYEAFDCTLPFGEKGEPLFVNLMEPQRAASAGDVTADWTHERKPLHFKLHLLGRKGRSYTTAKYGKVDSPPVRFLLAEDEEAGGASEFVACWEPYEREPFILKIERIACAGRDAAGFAPAAVRVTLAGGQVDTFFYTHDPAAALRAGEIEFQGSFGYISEQGGELRCLHLVNGSRLTVAGRGIVKAVPMYTSRIAAVDLLNCRLTLHDPVPRGASVAGRQLNIVAGGAHRTSYRIERVLDDRTLDLKLSAKIFQAKFTGADSAARSVTCEIAPPVETVRRFPPGYYNGAMLTDETLKARYRVRGVEKKTILVDRTPDPADFAAPDPFGRPMVHIFDYAEGDEVTIPGSVFLRRLADGTWERKAAFSADIR